jgi:hypothetical protein
MTVSQHVGGMTFVTGDLGEGWRSAARFAGPGGRVATLPDVIAARLATEPSVKRRQTPWDSYITTTSAEYAGLSKGGTAILIVAHGIGPMAKVEDAVGIYEACVKRGRVDYQDEGVRIPRGEFLKLESGAYGPVSIVPLEAFCSRYEYPFMEALSLHDARREPLVAARLGLNWEAYVEKHDAFMRGPWAKEEGILLEGTAKGPYAGIILDLGQPSPWYALGGANYNRGPKRLETYPAVGGPDPTEAFAHLLVVGQLAHVSYCEHRQRQLVSEFGCHGAGHHCRFLGLRPGADLGKILPDVSARDLLRDHWRDLLVATRGKLSPMVRITPFSPDKPGDFFTMTLKEGHEMDTGVHEHPVVRAKHLGTGKFVTRVEGYYGLLRYDLREVLEIAPRGANAYVLGEAGFGDDSSGHTHRVEVEFYQAEIDFGHRLMTAEELESDFNLFVELAAGHAA